MIKCLQPERQMTSPLSCLAIPSKGSVMFSLCKDLRLYTSIGKCYTNQGLYYIMLLASFVPFHFFNRNPLFLYACMLIFPTRLLTLQKITDNV